MFENRLFFVDKLVAMGARITLCDPHRAIVSGPSRLHGERVESPDIRAGMAMLIAALAADGVSEIGNIRQIDRGYERIDERLRGLGAQIERVAAEVPLARHRQSRRAPERRAAGGMRWRCRDPPDSTRNAGHPARRDARAARARRRRCSSVFERFGYGEVATPTIEYDEVLARGDERDAPRPPTASSTSAASCWRMRSDMTVPIARLVADPLRRRRAAVPPLLHRPTPTAPCARSGARCASSPRPGSS